MSDATPPAAPTPAPVPTQVKQPWRATLRTAFAVLVALAGLAPVVYAAATENDPAAATGAAAAALAVAAGITRVLAVPAVEDFLQKYLSFLAADSKGA